MCMYCIYMYKVVLAMEETLHVSVPYYMYIHVRQYHMTDVTVSNRGLRWT